MAFGLYKPGYGYWVRVMTATVLGIITLLGCAWLWGQLNAYTPPVKEWQLTVAGLDQAQPAAGTEARLLRTNTLDGTKAVIGTATVSGFDSVTGGSHLRLNGLALQAPASIDQVDAVEVGPAGSATSGTARSARPIAAFDKIYVQAAGIAALILAATWLGFWLIGMKPTTSEFLIATDGEMKKVNWSTRKDIIGSTQVVILWCILLAVGLFLVDTVFAKFFQLINVLEQ
jgi:preprotein translocase SecE subunit